MVKAQFGFRSRRATRDNASSGILRIVRRTGQSESTRLTRPDEVRPSGRQVGSPNQSVRLPLLDLDEFDEYQSRLMGVQNG
jgi:hypothetical protein